LRASRRVAILSSGGFTENSFEYTGTYNFNKSGLDWRLELLTSGTLSIKRPVSIDAFLVGGGGSGGYAQGNGSVGHGGGGGGGGYALTVPDLMMSAGDTVVTVGEGGHGTTTTNASGEPTYFGEYFAEGGLAGANATAGDGNGAGGGRGGSGGGGGGNSGKSGRSGGTTGNDGAAASNSGSPGIGQKSSGNTSARKVKYGQLPTYEFYAKDQSTIATAYGAGGKGGSGTTKSAGASASANTGGGGGGASNAYQTGSSRGGYGGSGIVILRNAR